MFDHLDIYDPRERRLVGSADLVLGAALRPFRSRTRRGRPPRRVLLLRLERIGDLLMSIGAMAAVRRLAPEAAIDLVVGSWNEPVARLLPSVDRVETIDAAWLVRAGAGSGASALARRAWSWRPRRYDLAINFEGDIRSHAIPWLAGAARRVGFGMAGGGPMLTDVVPHDPKRHVAANGLALVERAFDLAPGSLPVPPASDALADWRLHLPAEAMRAAEAAITQAAGGRLPGRLVALHAAGGRAIKQWPLERFAAAAVQAARDRDATIVLTGGPDDAATVTSAEALLAASGVRSIRAQGTDLILSAAVLARCDLLITGDTGPMHLAAAVGTPVVAVFGPSMPWRYGPIGPAHRIVRVDLPCSPCNRIRLPPERCQGHTPDCLAGVTVEQVVAAVRASAPGRVGAADR